MTNLRKLGCWTVIPRSSLPPNTPIMGTRWTYRKKTDENGTFTRYRGRLVAKGFSQILGVNYFESFSPVASFVTVFKDPVLLEHSPLLFDFLKTLMEDFGFENVALQRMTAQDMHCDPRAKSAPADELHLSLLTLNGSDHSFGVSSSQQIQELADRYRTWCCSSGKKGSVAVKVTANQHDDVFLLPRADKLPLLAVEQELLGGRDRVFETQHKTNPALKRIVPLHAGVPRSRKSVSLDAFWMSSREIADLRNRRKEEFRKQGAIVSTTMLANFRGTPQAAAHALEHAAQLALDAHRSSRLGSLIESQNKPVMVHQRDLEQFKEMLREGAIGNLQPGRQDYWSLVSREDHTRKSVEGGGSKVGPMTGQLREDHTRKCVEGGASKQGPMTGTDLQKHRALIAQGYTEKHKLMMQLANGKKGQENVWECSDSNRGTAVLYHFRADNEPTIDGVRQFEKYLLVHFPSQLTTKGAEAHNALKRMRAKADRDDASRERKKNRQGK